MAGKGRQLRQAAEAPVLSSSALAAGIRPFAGEREMWSAVSPAALRRRRMRSWLAGLWLVVGLCPRSCLDETCCCHAGQACILRCAPASA